MLQQVDTLAPQSVNMHRRQFLRRTGTGAAAAIGLPLLLKKTNEAPAIFKGEKTIGSSKWTMEISFLNSAVNRFSAATEEQKKMSMKAEYRKAAANSNADSKAEYNYVISEVLLLESSPKKAQVLFKKEKSEKEVLALPSELPKDLTAIIRPYLDLTLNDTKGKAFITLKYSAGQSSESYDDDEDCFLTTACVHHKSLPDDCHELQTLRHLRESYMRNTEEGRQLLKEYEILGPSILNSIREAENRSEVLDCLYEKLVIPGVQLTESGAYSDAVEHYRLFVNELVKEYLFGS